MKKLVLSLAIASTLGLSACDNETINDVKKDVTTNDEVVVPTARVVFDPSNGAVSVPNDLLFLGTQDGTLNPPVADPNDYSDPFVAASALDGWSSQQPFVIDFNMPAGVSLDAGSVFNPNSVKIFEMVMGGDLNDADCTPVPRGAACKVVSELVFSQDFIVQAQGSSIAVVPLKPFKPATTYLLAVTNHVEDSEGRPVAGSTTYELVKQDINSQPLGSQAQRDLQGLINSFETAVSSTGVDKADIIYTAAMTTQSVGTPLAAAKQLLVADPTAIPMVSVTDTGLTVADALIASGTIPATDPNLVGLYSAAKLMSGSITLPYYSGIPSAENPLAPINSSWKARCDSGAMIAGLAAANPSAIPANPVSDNDAFCMNFGLRDIGIDTERNITKYNPIPQANGVETLQVQITMPDPVVTNLTMPENGWPLVILQHGVTSQKEVMLGLTGLLSMYGFATVAIDHPLHNTRGYDLDPTSPGDELNATTVSGIHYINLSNLLAMRDNGNQSVADMLGLRVGMNFVPNIDGSNVSFVGHSLGAMSGAVFVTMANTPFNPAADGMFKIQTASLISPGGGTANFLMESGEFGGQIKSNLLFASSTDFQNFAIATAAGSGIEPNSPEWGAFLITAYNNFFAALTAEQQAEINGTFALFTFAAQTVLDSADPNVFASALAMTQTPIHLTEIVGDGGDNLGDQTIPNTVSTMPIGGTEGFISLLGLPGVSETTSSPDGTVSGAVRFKYGFHSSVLSPAATASAPDPVKNARVTAEIQSQIANFAASGGKTISITDSEVVH